MRRSQLKCGTDSDWIVMLIVRDVFRTQSNIYVGAFLRKKVTGKAVNYFRKKAPT